jgi:hypothetical protein
MKTEECITKFNSNKKRIIIRLATLKLKASILESRFNESSDDGWEAANGLEEISELIEVIYSKMEIICPKGKGPFFNK